MQNKVSYLEFEANFFYQFSSKKLRIFFGYMIPNIDSNIFLNFV